MARWTRFVLRHRRGVLVLWAVAIVFGAIAAGRISPLLANTFTISGSDAERARAMLEREFGDRPDGAFTVVFRVQRLDETTRAGLQRALERGARAVPSGRATQVRGRGDVLYGDITSTLSLTQAKDRTAAVERAVGTPRGVLQSYVTGPGPIQHALDPVFAGDLRKGESIAVPIALVVLLLVFGLSVVVTLPFVFAAASILGALGVMYGVVHLAASPTYVVNVIELIGLGMAVDYSLLVVYRFREELAGGLEVDDAVVRTMETAGRAVVFSGATVAIGLLVLVALPVPFLRMMGVAGFLIPVTSVAAALTLQPVMLKLYGRRGTARLRLLRRSARGSRDAAFWTWLAHSIMRRPWLYLAAGSAILLAAAAPVLRLQLTPGSSYGIPRTSAPVQGFDLLRSVAGPGAASPVRIAVDSGVSGGVASPPLHAALVRLHDALARDPEVAGTLAGDGPRFVSAGGRYAQLLVFGRHDYGQPESQSLVKRIRSRLIPAARFPPTADVLVGGGPAQGVDFLQRTYAYVPWLIVGVLALTYLLLMRAFRSVVLPLKAVILNLLSVAASYGVLVAVFRYGVGQTLFGLYRDSQVEGWIPPFLFATLFGLSMDYEVFLVTRMREAWDSGLDNVGAVTLGLERTGRIITAAAIIMVAAFSGFVTGRIVGLQEFGVGLASAVLIDATIVRSILVPSLMALFGRWNWWLPPGLARLVRVEPSPASPLR